MVSIDACMGLIIWFPEVPCKIKDAREKVDFLLEGLEKSREKILIPAPALAEILVHAGPAGPEFLATVMKSSRFQIAPFDTMAAVEVAEAIKRARKSGNKRGKSKDNWQKIKYDHQIVAISKVAGASVLYSNDGPLSNFAEINGLRVIQLADLPSPPSKTPLFDGVAELAEPTLEEKPNPLLLPAPSPKDPSA